MRKLPGNTAPAVNPPFTTWLAVIATCDASLMIVLREPSLPGLVLLDAQMPVISGACLLDVLRSHPATRDIPIVLVSTDSESPGRPRSDRFAADAYLTRPADLDSYAVVLAETLKHLLPRVL
jgi:CheY-like chemotaxis protein